MLDLTILCKIVDNFGDIGVVWRLVKAIKNLSEKSADLNIKIRLVVDDLNVFSKLVPEVVPQKKIQICCGIEIFDWNENDFCLRAFRKSPLAVILECFQCGRPDWLESLLFDEKVPNIVDIIMLDYLTAEDYAQTFHKLKSLTRSVRVQKVNFMMGFTQKTGGLILDEPFSNLFYSSGGEDSFKNLPLGSAAKLLRRKSSVSSPTPSSRVGLPPPPQRPPHSSSAKKLFDVLFFAYPRDFLPIVRALQKLNEKLGGNLKLNLAKEKGGAFQNAYEKQQKKENREPFLLEKIEFLPQTAWDKLLFSCDLLFVRGEDSLSRAALCGRPFVWHAYPQTEEYQLVKVRALLERLSQHFSKDDFGIVEKCWLTYNQSEPNATALEETLTDFLMNYEKLKGGFEDFSCSLFQNGDFAANLLEFILERQKHFAEGENPDFPDGK